jgi:hypothetical protein
VKILLCTATSWAAPAQRLHPLPRSGLVGARPRRHGVLPGTSTPSSTTWAERGSRPDIGRILPSSCSTATRGSRRAEAGALAERRRFVEANAALREHLPADVVFKPHRPRRSRRGRGGRAVWGQGARLRARVSMRGMRSSAPGDASRLRARYGIFAGTEHIRRVLDRHGAGDFRARPPRAARRRRRGFRPRPARGARRLIEEAELDPPNRLAWNERAPDEGTRSGSHVLPATSSRSSTQES